MGQQMQQIRSVGLKCRKLLSRLENRALSFVSRDPRTSETSSTANPWRPRVNDRCGDLTTRGAGRTVVQGEQKYSSTLYFYLIKIHIFLFNACAGIEFAMGGKLIVLPLPSEMRGCGEGGSGHAVEFSRPSAPSLGWSSNS